MIESVLVGCGFAFAAAVQPGPLQAFLLARVAADGWKRTLPASFAPLLSDGPIALVVLLVLRRLPPEMGRGLQAAGGCLLLAFAALSYRQWRRQAVSPPDDPAAAPRTLLQAAAVNILNPNPYLGWSLVLGPALVRAWSTSPGNAAALLVAFYGTMVVALALMILLFGTSSLLGPRGRRALLLLSALALAALGVFQLGASLWRG
jgi:threonine/homoserine/homoserine lactone efflux protein